jgi:hypothetical protein
MELKEPEDVIGWSHGNMEDKMDISAIVYIGGFDMKRVMQHQLILMCLCLSSPCVKNVSQLLTIEEVNGEATQVGSLEHMCQLLDVEVKLDATMV